MGLVPDEVVPDEGVLLGGGDAHQVPAEILTEKQVTVTQGQSLTLQAVTASALVALVSPDPR